jgi:SpoVK/Ycf46/Vps4 family AAA+-type ATPase
VAPLEPAAEWAEVDAFAKSFCTALAEAAPEKFTVALPMPRRRGRIFLDFLRNHRTATAVMPYSARARSGMPVAAPVTWDELEDIDRSDAFTVADVETLLKRARSRALRSWGTAAQRLPRLALKGGRHAGGGRRTGVQERLFAVSAAAAGLVAWRPHALLALFPVGFAVSSAAVLVLRHRPLLSLV